MEITHEQFEAAVQAAGVRSPYSGEALERALASLKITVKAKAPAATAALAREIAERTPGCDSDYDARNQAAFSALGAIRVVREQPFVLVRTVKEREAIECVVRAAILTKLGAI